MKLRVRLLICWLVGCLTGTTGWAQEDPVGQLSGRILGPDSLPVELASVVIAELNRGTGTDAEGRYRLSVLPNRDLTLVVKFVGYKTRTFPLRLVPGETRVLNVVLEIDSRLMEEVQVEGTRYLDHREEASFTKLDPRVVKTLPSAFGDFNRILATLPGVVATNELSSAYSVRGGNYDENLVYVNDIEVYRPLLARAGQQEGLSFINPDLVGDVEFSSGGWQPRFGDKLSSVLNVTYKQPTQFAASATASLLSSAAHVEGATKNQRFRYLAGTRYKSARYLLNTLPVEGDYLPRFYDFQTYLDYDLSRRPGERRTTIGLLASVAINRYFVEPRTQETTFGSISQTATRFVVGFVGVENYDYDTYQTGLRLSHRFRPNLRSDLIVSAVGTREREDLDVEGGYRLCDISTNPADRDFNQCLNVRGLGTFYSYSRNLLRATLYQALNRNYYDLSSRHRFEWGAGFRHDDIRDQLYEYYFIDSADFVNVTDLLADSLQLVSQRYDFYAQHTVDFSARHRLTYGGRVFFWTVNQQLLFSPRAQYSYKPQWERDIIFKLAAGVYQQPPFYRELRDRNAVLNLELRAQRSYHLVMGSDYNFFIWGRPFKFTSEVYGKYLTDVVPFDVENVRIRYFATNSATAYAVGTDLRLSGEFVKGAESWFSLGIMSTREDVEEDERGYIRRPTDQRVTVGVMFQDHMPNNPSVRMYLFNVFGSGLPQSPPNDIARRSNFTAPAYWRADIGFSKLVSFSDAATRKTRRLESIWISAEILNIFGFNNVISYQWIQDVNNQGLRVPNTLSARYLNIRVITRF